MMNSIKNLDAYCIIKNFAWRFAERFSSRIVAFLTFLLLARLIDPEDHGIIAMVMVILDILQRILDGGLGTALIQKKNADLLDFSSVFFLNIVLSFFCYVGLYCSAPWIADAYRMPEMVRLLRVLGILLIISSLFHVQQAYISRTMQFRYFFFATLGGTIGAAICGSVMAYFGYGVWALAAQQISNMSINVLILWFTVGWRPQWIFSGERLLDLWRYGWKLLAAAFLTRIYENMQQIFIGKLYSPSNLAFYNKASQLPLLLITNIYESIDSVLLPAMSNVQNDLFRVKMMTRRAIQVSVFLIAPLMIGTSSVAEPLIRFLLTDKWVPCIPYFQIFCITYVFYPIHTCNLNAIKALGRSDLTLKMSIIKVCACFIVFFCTMQHGLLMIVYGMLFLSIFGQIVNSWPSHTLLNYSYFEQIRDIAPSVILALVMGGGIRLLGWCGLSDGITLVIQSVLGIIIYSTGSAIFRLEPAVYLWGRVRPILTARFER